MITFLSTLSVAATLVAGVVIYHSFTNIDGFAENHQWWTKLIVFLLTLDAIRAAVGIVRLAHSDMSGIDNLLHATIVGGVHFWMYHLMTGLKKKKK